MALAAGDKLGPYEIMARIGASGVEEVRHQTEAGCALKVLQQAFAREAGRMARFQREAEVRWLANYNGAL
jgi:hypothetical protein